MLIVISGPIASGKSTLARAIVRELDERGIGAAAVDLDLVYEMLDPSGAPKNDDAKWARARRVSARLVDALLSESLVAIVEGDFLTPGKRLELTDALAGSVESRFVTLHAPFHVALRRARLDPTRGISRDPAFLEAHYAATAVAVRDAPPTDLALDTGVLGIGEAATTVVDWVLPLPG